MSFLRPCCTVYAHTVPAHTLPRGGSPGAVRSPKNHLRPVKKSKIQVTPGHQNPSTVDPEQPWNGAKCCFLGPGRPRLAAGNGERASLSLSPSSCARPQRVHPSTALIYRGRGAGAPGRCVPVKPGSVIGRKRGVFGPLFGKPAEKTRPFEQTQEPVPRNFPPVPTSRSATETERFRPVPLPSVLENPGLPGPGIPGAFWRRLPGPNPGRDPPGRPFVFFSPCACSPL